jgi:hypothetical protein
LCLIHPANNSNVNNDQIQDAMFTSRNSTTIIQLQQWSSFQTPDFSAERLGKIPMLNNILIIFCLEIPSNVGAGESPNDQEHVDDNLSNKICYSDTFR